MRAILCYLFLSVSATWAAPQAFFNYKIFYTPDKKPYISTALQFSAGTYKYKNTGEGLQANVEITQIFKIEDSIVFFDKYLLSSPLMADSIVEDFYDVQHYMLSPGVYNFEISIKDILSGDEISSIQSIQIDAFNEKTVFFSDIELVEDVKKTDIQNKFVKNGLFMLPYLTNYYPPEMDKIAFYVEVYNASTLLGEGQTYVLAYSISDYLTGKNFEGIFKVQRQQAQVINPIVAFLPIDILPSGDYDLQIALINADADTVATKSLFFQRRNTEQSLAIENIEGIQIDKSFETKISRDSIPYFLASLMPISPTYEYETIRMLVKGIDTAMMQKYFYAFWLKTSPVLPYESWLKYRSQVYYCQKVFGTQIKAGYETDRGRVYLKYGAPDAIMDRPNEPSAYPYQIWQYYRIGQRSNIRFVFYNPDLVTNDYLLLHSEMQGELQNYRWEHELHKRNSPFTNIDNENDGNTIHYGGNSSIYYLNP